METQGWKELNDMNTAYNKGRECWCHEDRWSDDVETTQLNMYPKEWIFHRPNEVL